MLDTLSRIGGQLNRANILWGVGASLLLKQYGLVDDPHDIDLYISLDDIARAGEVLARFGEKKPYRKSDAYATKTFYEYTVDGIDVDVMAGFAVNHQGGAYTYLFDGDSISHCRDIGGVSIPFAALEDWYVLYLLMPGKADKADTIERYFKKNGIRKPYLLNRALQGNLPEWARRRIKKLGQ